MSWQRWDLHPSVILGLALLGGLYVYLGGLRAPGRRVAAFAGALLVLGLSLNGPVHNLSDGYLFSAHMVQHLVLTLVFPPLLLYGTPVWVVRPLLRPLWVQRLARRATRPLAAGVLFSVPITLWHFPRFYEAALEHHPLHIVQHLIFLATGVLMWWPVLSPTPELPRAGYLTQLLNHPVRRCAVPPLCGSAARVGGGPHAARGPAAGRSRDVGGRDDLSVGRGDGRVVPMERAGRIR